MAKDIPIMMSEPMALRLLAEAHEAGTGKQMTRRLPTKQWLGVEVGDRLWVRENFWHFGRWAKSKRAGKVKTTFKPFPEISGGLHYAAHLEPARSILLAGVEANRGRFGQSDPAWHLRPNIFLPREVSRLTLTVTSKRVERLHDITETDCEREGLIWDRASRRWLVPIEGGAFHDSSPSAHHAWEWLWAKLHGQASWDANPEVVAIGFRVELRNIDAPPAVSMRMLPDYEGRPWTESTPEEIREDIRRAMSEIDQLWVPLRYDEAGLQIVRDAVSRVVRSESIVRPTNIERLAASGRRFSRLSRDDD